MSSAIIKHTHGAPKWWTKPRNTGRQLLEGNALAAEFVAEETFVDIREIRRIIFRMLGMNHLVFFLNACCDYRQPQGEMTIMCHTERLAFNEDNVRRLLWFALECGLELEARTQHMTQFGFRQRGIDHFTLCRSGLYLADCAATVTTVEMLTKLRICDVHLSGTVTRAVLDSTTFNAIPIFNESKTVIQASTRLRAIDSGAAVWFEILDMLFTYHQNASPMSSSLSIMAKCLQPSLYLNTMNLLVVAESHDSERRMLPYLLRKHDLSSGAIIVKFHYNDVYIDHIIKCAEFCKDNPGWPQACLMLINMFANHKQFAANVNRLPGLRSKSRAHIAAYVFANMDLGNVCELSIDLIDFIVKHATFVTDSNVDCVLTWMAYKKNQHKIDIIACVFAHLLFQTRPDIERAVIYEQYLKVRPTCHFFSELIYYLMHGEDSFGTYALDHRCSIYLTLDMLTLELENSAIAHIIAATHVRDLIPVPPNCIGRMLLELCKKGLRFDLLIRLVHRHYRVTVPNANALQLIMSSKH